MRRGLIIAALGCFWACPSEPAVEPVTIAVETSTSALAPASPKTRIIPCDGNVIDDLIKPASDNYIQHGLCFSDRTIVAERGTVIRGASQLLTQITVRHQRDGIWIRGESEIHDLALVSERKTCSATIAAGIKMNAGRGGIERVAISGFTYGIWARGNATREKTNVNVWRFRDLKIREVDHAGVRIEGADANAGLGESFDIVYACNCKTKALDVLGPCAPLIDRGFLGNTHIAHHVATAGALGTRASYIVESDNARSVFVGCYAERGLLPATLSPWSIAVGGPTNWSGPGAYLFGRRMSAFEVVNGDVEFRLGPGVQDTAMTLAAPGVRDLRIKADRTKKSWRLELQNTPKLDAIRIDDFGRTWIRTSTAQK